MTRPLRRACAYLTTYKNAAINSSLVGRNSLVVEYNDILPACLGCNTNVNLLGSEVKAKAGSIYVFKYFSNDIALLTQAITKIKNARTEMDKYPSTAEDDDPVRLTDQLFLSCLVNEISGLMEVSAMLAAAIQFRNAI